MKPFPPRIRAGILVSGNVVGPVDRYIPSYIPIYLLSIYLSIPSTAAGPKASVCIQPSNMAIEKASIRTFDTDMSLSSSFGKRKKKPDLASCLKPPTPVCASVQYDPPT